MKQVFLFTQSIMNGTVTIDTEVALFETLELAEQTLADLKKDNAKHKPGNVRVSYGNIEVAYVYETKDEIPFYKTKKD